MPGACQSDLLNIINNWMKNVLESGLFCILYLAVEKKYVSAQGRALKKGMDSGKRSAYS